MQKISSNVALFFTAIVISSGVFAKEAPELTLAKQILKRYRVAEAVDIKISKTVDLGLIGESKTSEGKLLLSKGRLKLSISKPDPSQVIMNKKEIWVITPTPEDLGGKTQALRIKTNNLQESARAPIAFLLGDETIWDKLKIIQSEKKDQVMVLKLAPKKTNSLGDVTGIEIELNQSRKEINFLSYRDELDNQTKYAFLEANFKAKACDKDFSFKPDSKTQVTEYK